MAHTYTSSLFHCVFSTKNRERNLTRAIRERLWPFIGGIARANNMKAIAVGGYLDHAHLLLSLPSTLAVAKAMQIIKAGASQFIHENFLRKFAWQEGYGAFTVGVADINRTIDYINSQEEHHRTKTLQEEFVSFLKKHAIEYDERYIWG